MATKTATKTGTLIEAYMLQSAVRAVRSTTIRLNESSKRSPRAYVWLSVSDGYAQLASFDGETHTVYRWVNTGSLDERPYRHRDLLKVASIAAKRSCTVTIEHKPETRILSSDGISFRMQDHPEVAERSHPEPVKAKPTTIDADVFKSSFGPVIDASATDYSRPILTGVGFDCNKERFDIAGTDSYRLAIASVPQKWKGRKLDQETIVPASALKAAMAQGADVSMKVDKNHVELQSGYLTITARLIDGSYPNYRGLAPDPVERGFTCDRKELLRAVADVSAIQHESKPVRIEAHGGDVKLSMVVQGSHMSNATVRADIKGDFDSVAFNPDFTLGSLRALEGQSVTFRAIDQVKPVVLTGSNEAVTLILMPVRVP